MRRVFLLCVALALGLAGGTILWYAPDLYAATDSWHSAAFTRMVGVAVIVEGMLCALGAALCLGRAIIPLTSARAQSGTDDSGKAPSIVGSGPILPIWGILFLVAALGSLGQASKDSDALEVMDSNPGQWGADIVADFRRQERTEWTFAVLWLVVGGALLATPLFLKSRLWQLGWQISAVGCGIAIAGFMLSGLGALICLGNGLALEGASKELAFAGYVGVLAGAVVAVIGSSIAVIGKSIR